MHVSQTPPTSGRGHARDHSSSSSAGVSWGSWGQQLTPPCLSPISARSRHRDVGSPRQGESGDGEGGGLCELGESLLEHAHVTSS